MRMVRGMEAFYGTTGIVSRQPDEETGRNGTCFVYVSRSLAVLSRRAYHQPERGTPMNLHEQPAQTHVELAPPSPPSGAELTHLKSRDRTGLLYFAWSAGLTGGALALSALDSWALWALGQVLLAVALVQWFVLLHEAGHNTLFR